MAQIELRERFFGPGVVGTIDTPSSGDVERLRYAFVESAEHAARELTGLRSDVASLGWSLDTIASSIWTLEASLGARLDAQAAYLADQVRVLESIDQAMRSPAKVRAAERMGDAAGLLRSGRNERALQCAQEAIDADPNHPGGFAAAGWALIGLGRWPEARSNFAEASLAAPAPEESAAYARQAARVLLVLEQPNSAAQELENLLAMEISDQLRAGIEYDIALAFVLQSNDGAAADWVAAAVRHEESFAQAAVAEPVFQGHGSVVLRAIEVAREIAEARAVEEQRRADEQRLREEAARRRQQDLDGLREYREGLDRRVPFAASPAWEKNGAAEFTALRLDLLRFLQSAPQTFGPDTDVNAALAALAPAERMLERLDELRRVATTRKGRRFFNR